MIRAHQLDPGNCIGGLAPSALLRRCLQSALIACRMRITFLCMHDALGKGAARRTCPWACSRRTCPQSRASTQRLMLSMVFAVGAAERVVVLEPLVSEVRHDACLHTRYYRSAAS